MSKYVVSMRLSQDHNNKHDYDVYKICLVFNSFLSARIAAFFLRGVGFYVPEEGMARGYSERCTKVMVRKIEE